MADIVPMTVLDRPWLRSIIASVCSLLIFALLLVTVIGIDEVAKIWTAAPNDAKLVPIVLAGAYLIWQLFALFQKEALETFWSDTPLLPGARSRFSELIVYADYYDEYAYLQYGMQPETFWPRLLLVLPPDVKTTVSQSRGTFLSAQVLASSFGWWFETTCPIWCGVLAYTAFCSSEYRFAFFLALAFALHFIFRESFGGQTRQILGKLHIFLALLNLCSRRLWGRLLVLSLLGWVLVQAFSAPMDALSDPYIRVLTNWRGWDPGWFRIIAVSGEIFGLGLIAEVCEGWFLTSGLSYGQLCCGLFDVYRYKLAEGMKVSLPEDKSEENKKWQEVEASLNRTPENEVVQMFSNLDEQLRDTEGIEFFRRLFADWKPDAKLVWNVMTHSTGSPATRERSDWVERSKQFSAGFCSILGGG